jgi:glycosyltransferase involved in cell wall biosynthesis
VAKRLAGSLASFAYRNAEHVVALSPGMAAGVTARYAPARTTVIPNASDLELFSNRGEEAQRFRAEHDWLGDRPLVVYTGTVGPANGVAYLVRLAALVRSMDPDVRFLILGHGKEWEQTRQLAVDLGVLDDTLHMWPELPKAEIPVVLAAATMATSVFVPLPSLRDNSANKFFDALAAGRPIAINYGGWQRDLLLDSEAGVVLDYDDLSGAATNLVAHLHDREWLSLAGKAAHHLAVEQFSRDMLFDRFESVLAEAAASRGHGQHRSPEGRRRRPGHRAVATHGGTRSGTA